MDVRLASAVSDATYEVLDRTVMLAHRQGRRGDKGGWEEFRGRKSSISDPERETMIAFLLSFTEKDDLKFLDHALLLHSNQEVMEQLLEQSPDSESPQQRLVRLTLEHPYYSLMYLFPPYDKDCVVTKLPEISKLMKSSEILALDCHWVLCEDGTKSVARICVVDHNLQVKLDEKVNPMKPVANYRTMITGITAADLDGVSYTFADAQRFVKKLLKKGTILVGHDLHKDLSALRMDYARVINTSIIFSRFDGHPFCLETLCKYVLGYEVRVGGAPHDCVDDARAAMRLVHAKIEHKEVLPIPRKRVLESKDLPDLRKLKIDECFDPLEEKDDNQLNVGETGHGNKFSEMPCPKKGRRGKCGEELGKVKEKTEGNDDNHLIEIERLKEGISAKDFHISSLDKIINNLRKELELNAIIFSYSS